MDVKGNIMPFEINLAEKADFSNCIRYKCGTW